MRKSDSAAGAAPSGAPKPTPLGAAPASAFTSTSPVKTERKPAVAIKRVIPVSFVGAYSDVTGAYVLSDYLGTTYTARQGPHLFNGWTVASVEGFVVNLVDGKRKWTETIPSPTDMPVTVLDSASVRAITDLGSPLPPGGLASASPSFVPFAK